jgi:hypothetical protein
LFAFVSAAAMAAAALAKPTYTWCCYATATAFSLLLFSLPCALYGGGGSRAFWTGFAAVGFGVVGVLYLEGHSGSSSWPVNVSHLLEPIRDAVFPNQPRIGPFTPYHAWLRIAKVVITLLLAFAGGLVARHLFLRRERESFAGNASKAAMNRRTPKVDRRS